MSVRRTRTIVTDTKSANELAAIRQESDVIMTAAILGLAATTIQAQIATKDPSKQTGIRFDMDPKDVTKDAKEWATFQQTVGKINQAVLDYVKSTGLVPKNSVQSGKAEDFTQGAVIMGVYQLAGHQAPVSVQTPNISANGKTLYQSIANNNLPDKDSMYIGRGAYTGFVDNYTDPKSPNTKTAAGPFSTARFVAPQTEPTGHGDSIEDTLYPRWLPPPDSPVWAARKRGEQPNKGTYIAWGLIGGDRATETVKGSQPPINWADATTNAMQRANMKFYPEKDDLNSKDGTPPTEIAGYTHGMIQAIYKAYHSGPGAVPYEIAVGSETTKLSSCFACTTFMTAVGYPPTSIHLGRAESWLPLYYPYNPDNTINVSELPVVRDLNNKWFLTCEKYLTVGLAIMDDAHINPDHKAARDNVKSYLQKNKGPSTPSSVPATLILDALTCHKSEAPRANDTLK